MRKWCSNGRFLEGTFYRSDPSSHVPLMFHTKLEALATLAVLVLWVRRAKTRSNLIRNKIHAFEQGAIFIHWRKSGNRDSRDASISRKAHVCVWFFCHWSCKVLKVWTMPAWMWDSRNLSPGGKIPLALVCFHPRLCTAHVCTAHIKGRQQSSSDDVK